MSDRPPVRRGWAYWNTLIVGIIGNIAWIALLKTIAVVCGATVHWQTKRQRQDWESGRT